MLKAFGEQARSVVVALRLLFGNRILVDKEVVDKVDNWLGSMPADEPVDASLLLGDGLQRLPDGRFLVDFQSLDKLDKDPVLWGVMQTIQNGQAKDAHIEQIRAVAQIMVSALLLGFGVYVLAAIDDADIRMAAAGWIGLVGGYWLR